ncbi:hypothetical protein NW754_008855 [Fusarium falciforme]|nr:hypothetical protein NW754_008855 [Fusarium falciforme]
MSSSHLNLSAASDDRKARLAKLKNLKRKQPGDEIVAPESERAASPPQNPMYLDYTSPDATTTPRPGAQSSPTLEEQAAEVEAEIKQKAAEEAQDDKGIDLFKLQPKKPNWDLKRELDKKMEVLNVRTDNAIARLVRDRITGAQKAASKTKSADGTEGDGEAAGMDGVALVEGLRVREREEAEEERREREEEAALGA